MYLSWKFGEDQSSTFWDNWSSRGQLKACNIGRTWALWYAMPGGLMTLCLSYRLRMYGIIIAVRSLSTCRRERSSTPSETQKRHCYRFYGLIFLLKLILAEIKSTDIIRAYIIAVRELEEKAKSHCFVEVKTLSKYNCLFIFCVERVMWQWYDWRDMTETKRC